MNATVKDSVTSAIVKRYVYGYDKAGNRLTEQIDNAITKGTFNNVNQLTSQVASGGEVNILGNVSEPATVTVNGTSASVNFSATGSTNNLFQTSMTNLSIGTNSLTIIAKDYSNNTKTNTFSVNIASGSAKTITMDANGNLTNMLSGTVNTAYSWDAADRLVGISTNGVQVASCGYDGMGRRTRIVQGTTTNMYLWCGTEICEQRNAAGNTVVKRYFPQGMQVGTTNLFYTRDHLGSVREVADSTGTIRARYDYSPYGVRTKVSGDLDSDFGFTGHYFHAASGLNLTLYRAYDPETGRWLSRDPIGEDGGLNLYGYAGNNPVNLVDPLGLWTTDIHNYLIDHAFPNLSQADRDVLKGASAEADSLYPGQLQENSYTHAMAEKGEDPNTAARRWTQFIKEMQDRARSDDCHKNSLNDFGKGLHAVADSTSPSHRDFQPWEPEHLWAHHNKEKSIGIDDYQKTIKLMRQYYQTTYGAKSW